MMISGESIIIITATARGEDGISDFFLMVASIDSVMIGNINMLGEGDYHSTSENQTYVTKLEALPNHTHFSSFFYVRNSTIHTISIIYVFADTYPLLRQKRRIMIGILQFHWCLNVRASRGT